ncbi:MAG TPA: hypothetical protein VL614_25165, partial [Acetobacteraceae bacterium]|nr:hypothetical protein [Acetobacteraceae bacterium]
QAADVGGRGTLDINGVDFSVPFDVRAVEGDIMHVAFDLDAAAAAKFETVIERLVLRHAA